MTNLLDRRALLFGRSRPAADPVRPPGALPEAAFRSACDGCAACATACPAGIVRLDGGRRPILDFSQGECTFCAACTEACPTGALAAAGARPWTVRAAIGPACLAVGGVACRSCGDACGSGAIRFSPCPDGRFLPVLREEACTGCGACVSVCPAGAVAVRPTPAVLPLGRAS
ncbi:ferredoxin-type protein NapF [Prosthecomicrobium sp. N25]|uniref:ferredoxin-type protein NapF n=1 Tax=Prosthecomicrobium sp. N25 TaxID=3129254 RepID=UPI00307866DA